MNINLFIIFFSKSYLILYALKFNKSTFIRVHKEFYIFSYFSPQFFLYIFTLVQFIYHIKILHQKMCEFSFCLKHLWKNTWQIIIFSFWMKLEVTVTVDNAICWIFSASLVVFYNKWVWIIISICQNIQNMKESYLISHFIFKDSF